MIEWPFTNILAMPFLWVEVVEFWWSVRSKLVCICTLVGRAGSTITSRRDRAWVFSTPRKKARRGRLANPWKRDHIGIWKSSIVAFYSSRPSCREI
jgi:hypothetical protein